MFAPQKYLDLYRHHLLEDCVPWWLKHAIDARHGGLFTGIADDGTIQTRHKFIWSNARALYTFSELCRRFGEVREWREVADGLYQFLRLYLGIDADGKEPIYWQHHDKKIWWVSAEALPALLMAYEQLAEPWCLEWFERIHDWSFAHFPNKTHGEWTQKLNRQGQPIDTLIALPVKDPFHLPRSLMMAIETLERLVARTG